MKVKSLIFVNYSYSCGSFKVYTGGADVYSYSFGREETHIILNYSHVYRVPRGDSLEIVSCQVNVYYRITLVLNY